MSREPMRFGEMNHLQRVVECFRYNILSFESWMSPDGKLRRWLRMNCLVFTWLIIPAVTVMPVVNFILWQLTLKFVVLILFLLALGLFRKCRR